MYKPILTAIVVAATLVVTVKAQTNPLLIHSNIPIQFGRVNAAAIHDAAISVIKTSNAAVKTISAVPRNKQTVTNTLRPFDDLLYGLVDLSFKLGLIGVTFTSDDTRNAANDEAGKLGLYLSNLYLNESLYKALKQFSTSTAASGLTSSKKKFLAETLLAFEKNGMKLDAGERKRLQAINEKLTYYSIQFEKNLAESKDSVTFSEDDLRGVVESTKKPWRRASGNYIVYVNGPNTSEVLSNATNEKTRQAMYIHYNNRAYPGNIKVLDSLFYYRNEFANKLGFRSYAEYALVDKMAKTTANVWAFENELRDKLASGQAEEINELKQFKKQLYPDQPETMNDWDFGFYTKKLLDTKYQLNIDEVKQYFEMNNTLQGMFIIYEKLLSIKIKEVKGLPTWYEKVKAYEMFKDGKKIGSFYLDLFPRPDKYTHFACFPISLYKTENGKEVLPVSALICNFPEGNASEPSLLYHSQVVTLFHEFGHLVHSMLARSELAMQGPFFVKGDFGEAPSQFLENWVWQYASLQQFAKNYKTGESLSMSLFDKMQRAKSVGEATANSRQVYLGILDFTYEDKYDSLKGRSIMDVSKDLYAIRQTPFPEGSHFIASFTHLNGYAANYYGYLWSKVFAEDMFSVFKQNGVMDVPTGLRYRKEILEPGSTKEEMEMLRSFLGREPNSEAFLQSLGIKQ